MSYHLFIISSSFESSPVFVGLPRLNGFPLFKNSTEDWMDLWDLGILIANRAYQAGRFWKQPWIWRRQKLWGRSAWTFLTIF
jgi:hypothetical protein